MGMQLNTGDTGRAVTASADGSLYSKIFGNGCFVLAGGNELKAEIQSNNSIKIYDGDIAMQGRHAYIPASDSDNVTISNGSQGMNRKDLIVARYSKDSTGREDVTLHVIQGTATSGTAARPSYTDGDILKGATTKDFPLYEVSLTGINITEVKKLFDVIGSIGELEKQVTELNGKTTISANGICTKYSNGIMVQHIKAQRATTAWATWGSLYYASVAGVDYLEPFTELIDLQVNFRPIDVNASQLLVGDGTLAKTPSAYMLRPAIANPSTIMVHVYAVGRWK